jgi:hypothetical protein
MGKLPVLKPREGCRILETVDDFVQPLGLSQYVAR